MLKSFNVSRIQLSLLRRNWTFPLVIALIAITGLSFWWDPPPRIAYKAGIVAIIGTLIVPLSPVNNGGFIASCASSPTLPAGLVLSNADCSISGRPRVSVTRGNYTIIAASVFGHSTTNVTIDVTPAQPPSVAPLLPPATPRPLIGAIRWDFWFRGNPTVPHLRLWAWSSRWPVFTHFNSNGTLDDTWGDMACTDNTSIPGVVPPGAVFTASSRNTIPCADTSHSPGGVIDDEIFAARDGGIDYWVFNYYPSYDWQIQDCTHLPNPNPDPGSTNASLRMYESSWYRYSVNHALLISHTVVPTCMWRDFVNNTIIAHMREGNYQKVLGNHPLLYMTDMFWWVNRLDDDGIITDDDWLRVKEQIDYIRTQAINAGLGSPYIVNLDWNPTCSPAQTANGRVCSDTVVQKLGLDAMSEYGSPANNKHFDLHSLLTQKVCQTFSEDTIIGTPQTGEILCNEFSGPDPERHLTCNQYYSADHSAGMSSYPPGYHACLVFYPQGPDAVTTPQGDELEYHFCKKMNRWFREWVPANFNLVPPLSAGWDPRPVMNLDESVVPPMERLPGVGDPYISRGYWNNHCKRLTPEQLADNIRETESWMQSKPSLTNANTLLVYAWNEYAEGGFIAPMYQEGSLHLDAIRRVVDANRCEITKPKGCPNQAGAHLDAPLIFETYNNANNDQNSCFNRASTYSWYCGFDPNTQPILGQFYSGGKLLAEYSTASSRCEILKFAGCPNHPGEHQPPVILDNYQNAANDPARCAQRAQDYASYCGFGADHPVIAVFNNGTQVTTTSTATNRCQVVKPAGCPNNPDSAYFQQSVIYDNWNNAANDSGSCMQRAADYAAYCGLPADSVHTYSFINDALVGISP